MHNKYFKKSLLPIIFVFYCSSYKAQLKFKHISPLVFVTTNSAPINFSPFESRLKVKQTSKFVNGLKIEIPKLPFFCGMEEKCRQRLGLFIKLRIGNDDTYRRMINTNN